VTIVTRVFAAATVLALLVAAALVAALFLLLVRLLRTVVVVVVPGNMPPVFLFDVLSIASHRFRVKVGEGALYPVVPLFAAVPTRVSAGKVSRSSYCVDYGDLIFGFLALRAKGVLRRGVVALAVGETASAVAFAAVVACSALIIAGRGIAF
jgi:hypothetical protein